MVEAGVARDPARGTPYECLHVALLDSSGKAIAHTVTDSAGRFLLEAPRPGVYRVQFNVYRWEPLVGPVDTLREGEFKQRAYPLVFKKMLVPDSTFARHRARGGSEDEEYRQRYKLFGSYMREQESDSGWRSHEPIPQSMSLRYPPRLYQAGIDGNILSQFIVDSTGMTRRESWHTIATTHPDFETAVESSIPEWRWKPARNRGQPVCELTFDFIRFYHEGDHVGHIVLETR